MPEQAVQATTMPAQPEVRRNKDGSLDEIVAHGAYVHLEQMAPGHWWMVIESGGRAVHVNLNSAKVIKATSHAEAS